MLIINICIYDTINTNDLYLSVKTDKVDKNIHMKLNVKTFL